MAKKYLYGHTNSDNAYVIDDYPYGFNQRTKMRVWIETKPGKGDRMVTQTLNPKTDKWNKPKESTFSSIGFLYLDEKDHIHWNGVSPYSNKDEVEQFVKEIGGVSKLNKYQLKQYKSLSGKLDDSDVVWSYKFEKTHTGGALDIKFDDVNSIKLSKVIDTLDAIIGNKKSARDGSPHDKFKSLIDSDGIIRIKGKKGVMIGGPFNAKKTYDQLKGKLKNKIKESISKKRIRDMILEESNKLNEELTPNDYKEIKDIIRAEIAAVFFDLFKKKSVWL